MSSEAAAAAAAAIRTELHLSVVCCDTAVRHSNTLSEVLRYGQSAVIKFEGAANPNTHRQ